MLKNRMERLNGSIKKVVLEVINTRLDNPAIPPSVSVTRVDTTPDMSISRVHIDCLGTDAERQAMLRAVKSAGGLIRGEVSRRIQIRITPRLEFYLDEGDKHSQRIEEIFKSIVIPPLEEEDD
ncbi:MAG: 30S ribosome-binding factor RbfA [Clostridia bacterium]